MKLACDSMLKHEIIAPFARDFQRNEGAARFVLDLKGDLLTLTDTENPEQKPISAEDLIKEWYQRIKSSRNKQEPLAKAFGLHKRPPRQTLIDTTAGLGRDGIILASLGVKLFLIERELALACLLTQALQIAQEQAWFAPFAGNIEFHYADAKQACTQVLLTNHVHGFYCDPMFNHKKNKSAQNKKLVQTLQNLCQEDNDPIPTFLITRLQPGQRLVIKRAPHEPRLEAYFSHQITGKTFRFDVHNRNI